MADPERIPFVRPYIAGTEISLIGEAIKSAARQGDGPFTKQCQAWLSQRYGTSVLLTQSCTSALEMAALLSQLGRGDEVIMPSFTFASTANAFVLRGATPVFVDVDPGTQNIDAAAAGAAIGPRTRAIVAMHYGGVSCDMRALGRIAAAKNLLLIEDAAQAIQATFDGKLLGSIGQMGALSFHDTKNVSSGEGGALIIAERSLIERAEIVWEKGTNRLQFHRGTVDKYSWLDVGSSFLPSEITAAFLLAQLRSAERITELRLAVWQRFHDAFAELERAGDVTRPVVPEECKHNGHLYYLIVDSRERRDKMLDWLNRRGVGAVFHYVPLHSSQAGRKFGKTHGKLPNTDRAGNRLVRLPLWPDMTDAIVDRVIREVKSFFRDA
jgi:dTDP-4-amino-4,6-dideoxygalactose transaminase